MRIPSDPFHSFYDTYRCCTSVTARCLIRVPHPLSHVDLSAPSLCACQHSKHHYRTVASTGGQLLNDRGGHFPVAVIAHQASVSKCRRVWAFHVHVHARQITVNAQTGARNLVAHFRLSLVARSRPCVLQSECLRAGPFHTVACGGGCCRVHEYCAITRDRFGIESYSCQACALFGRGQVNVVAHSLQLPPCAPLLRPQDTIFCCCLQWQIHAPHRTQLDAVHTLLPGARRPPSVALCQKPVSQPQRSDSIDCHRLESARPEIPGHMCERLGWAVASRIAGTRHTVCWQTACGSRAPCCFRALLDALSTLAWAL